MDSLDGEIGEVQEFYFDDCRWVVRYLVADTGTWLMDREVLISPHALGAVIVEEEHLKVDLTQKQIEGCPLQESDKPVSRQFEETYHGYYGWPMYWQESGPLGPNPISGISSTAAPEFESRPKPVQTERDYETALHHHYQREGYWSENPLTNHVNRVIFRDKGQSR